MYMHMYGYCSSNALHNLQAMQERHSTMFKLSSLELLPNPEPTTEPSLRSKAQFTGHAQRSVTSVTQRQAGSGDQQLLQ
jgi:hypothetical protein